MLRKVLSGISAGVAISLGGAVYLAVDNKIAAAVLFSVALLCICYRGYGLFTGKVGFLPEDHGKENVSVTLLSLFGNLVGTVCCGYLIRFALPALGETALGMCGTKLEQPFFSTLVRAFFCGVLMYLAVSIFRDKKTPIGILFCIPVFILSGFEHSIADMFYFAASGIVSLRACGFLWTVILGNALGGMLLPVLNLGAVREEKEKQG